MGSQNLGWQYVMTSRVPRLAQERRLQDWELSCHKQTMYRSRVVVMSLEHRLMEGRNRGVHPPARNRAHIFQSLLSTAGTRVQPAEPRWLLQPLRTTSTSHWSPPGWWETWSTRLRGHRCAEKPEACKVEHTFVAWHHLFPTGVGEQAPCAFQSPFPLHIASQWQY